ncbi:hypothetical protein [Pseudomonas sp. MWU12-2345]|uniref:hypothetical protein n=1 Tax=Pseudomonas sp. MWU12-2345 TaxID=2928689 RepID=UPI00200CA1CF|nr:hypothetical protein [Pseudomonas sp. MWU12-2345]
MSKNRGNGYRYQILRSAALLLPLSINATPSNLMTREVSMKKPKHEPKPMMAARFQAEARAALVKRSDKRNRFLDVALAQGAEFEPVGRLAG